jgi:hypothetical protein
MSSIINFNKDDIYANNLALLVLEILIQCKKYSCCSFMKFYYDHYHNKINLQNQIKYCMTCDKEFGSNIEHSIMIPEISFTYPKHNAFIQIVHINNLMQAGFAYITNPLIFHWINILFIQLTTQSFRIPFIVSNDSIISVLLNCKHLMKALTTNPSYQDILFHITFMSY